MKLGFFPSVVFVKHDTGLSLNTKMKTLLRFCVGRPWDRWKHSLWGKQKELLKERWWEDSLCCSSLISVFTLWRFVLSKGLLLLLLVLILEVSSSAWHFHKLNEAFSSILLVLIEIFFSNPWNISFFSWTINRMLFWKQTLNFGYPSAANLMYALSSRAWWR